MLKRTFIICLILISVGKEVKSQTPDPISVNILKKEINTLPGQIVNLPFFITNNTAEITEVSAGVELPEGWNVISKTAPFKINPSEQKFSVYTLQIPAGFPVGTYDVTVVAKNANYGDTLSSRNAKIQINEIENITLQRVELPEHVMAGETFTATFLLQNLGNTAKKILVETQNCVTDENPEIMLNPGESRRFTVSRQISSDVAEVRKEYFTVRAILSGDIRKSIFSSVIIFPSRNIKKDIWFRYPVSASASYLSTNVQDKYQAAYQFELKGSGPLDPEGKHQLEFLARGPNNTDLNFLGLYNQYYISYGNKNLEMFVGEKAFAFTPLTESSRFGLGTENRIILNNGLSFGQLFVKPRFYENIENEMAFFTNYTKNINNEVELYYVVKKEKLSGELTQLGSLNGKFSLLKKTSAELEVSRGVYNGVWDNAFRASLSTQVSILGLSGNYYYTGKNFPGYFSNSTFYSGTATARITSNLNIGIYAKQDFINAELDTFFITAPYSKQSQTFVNYKIAPRSHLRVYWRESERKDRLSFKKFHYKTQSFNSQFTQRFRKMEYNVTGEFGETTNLLLAAGENRQTTYRGSLNLMYRLSSLHSFRIFGSWSNINSFVSDEQRNLTAGLSVSSQLWKNFRANFHIQNAYDIDEYYLNRNLMQLNVDYKFLKNHTLSLRSFYTIFRQQTDNPEFTMSATYTCNFGVPIKQMIKAGDLKGRITNDDEAPVEGVLLNLLNKTAITDKNGEFVFKSIVPGKHLLTVDRSKIEIDETTSIVAPIEIEIIEDHESFISFRITKGAKLSGGFVAEKNNTAQDEPAVKLQNIIVGLKSEFEQFRITTDENGSFSFPVIRPGAWTFKIYINSLPAGFETENSEFAFTFTPGDKKELPIVVKPKKRNIIFKSQNMAVTSPTVKIQSSKKESALTVPNKSTSMVLNDTTRSAAPEPVTTPKISDTFYYSIQIGAFKKRVKPNSRFFKGEQTGTEKQMDNLYKYFIGKFENYDEAVKEKNRLSEKFKGAFIVTFENDKLPDNKELNK
jgi:hypothetical protein